MQYRILPGHSFLDSDGTVKTGGDIIELGQDVARAHPDKVEPIPDGESGSNAGPAYPAE